jgi:hypothetical protein
MAGIAEYIVGEVDVEVEAFIVWQSMVCLHGGGGEFQLASSILALKDSWAV